VSTAAPIDGTHTTLDAALAYWAAGLSVSPIREDGSKRPFGSWEEYQHRLAEETELRRWFADGRLGLSIVGGAVSGNLEHLDFDKDAEVVFPAWSALVDAEAPGLVGRLSVRRTPGQGYHVSYRCTEVTIPGNSKLAMAPDPSDPKKRLTLIETRGEGGQVLVPGCPAKCHPSGRTYVHHSGPKLSQVQTITAAERDILIRAAQSFDCTPAEQPRAAASADRRRPGDDYNEGGPDWADILHGWKAIHNRGAIRNWRRPGKDEGGVVSDHGCLQERRRARAVRCLQHQRSPVPWTIGRPRVFVPQQVRRFCPAEPRRRPCRSGQGSGAARLR
jgi:hypothetical protein